AERGEPVRALVRSGRGTARLRALGVALEPGDMRDPRALRRALRGVRAVITTAQGSPFRRDLSYEHVDGEGNRMLIQAAGAARVERFVFVSALKADEAANVPQLACKHAAELQLRASGMSFTILRPSSLQEIFGTGHAPLRRAVERGVGLLLAGGRAPHSFVAARDVARAAVVALEHPAARERVVEVGGPEDLSYREAYWRIAQITGRRIHQLPLPLPLLAAGGVLASPLAPGLAGLSALLAFQERTGYTCTTPDWLLAALGGRRSFDEGVRDMYGAAADRTSRGKRR
ncbi:MAG TPA: NAD(P)H-binding protein, partial [Roseiflexaceae bacterium]|nr:NAD(P)H-binding protein [Roseiflexaceae bacterium]